MKKLFYFVALCTLAYVFIGCSKNGSVSQREEPTVNGTIQLLNTTNDPYSVTISGNTPSSFTQKGNTSVEKEVEAGYYDITVKQQSGYILYPTTKSWSGYVNAGKTRIVSY